MALHDIHNLLTEYEGNKCLENSTLFPVWQCSFLHHFCTNGAEEFRHYRLGKQFEKNHLVNAAISILVSNSDYSV